MFLLTFLFFYTENICNRDVLNEMELRGIEFERRTMLTDEPFHYFSGKTLLKLPDYFNPAVSFSSSYSSDTVSVLKLFPSLRFTERDYGFCVDFIVQKGNSVWPHKEWKKGIKGAYRKAYLFVDKTPFFFLFGKNTFTLNNGTLLDNTDPPHNMFYFDYKFSNFIFSYFFSQLTSGSFGADTYNRFLVGHSLDYAYKSLTLSLTELCMFYNDAYFPDLYYLNPLVIYHLKAWNGDKEGETNIFWLPSVKYKFGSSMIKAELGVDELQYDRYLLREEMRYVPPQLIWRTGFYLVDFPVPESFFSIEYSGATRWALNHGEEILNWTNHREIMGNIRDSDMDKLEIFFLKHLEKLSLGFRASYGRYGAGTISEEDNYWGGNIPYPQDFFMVGVVEEELTFSPVVRFKSEDYFIELSPGLSGIKNYNHESGEEKISPSLSVFFSYTF